MEVHRLTGASLGLGKTLLSASHNLFLTSLITSVFHPQAPPLQTLQLEPTSTIIEEETKDPVDENKKKRRKTLSDCSSPHYKYFPCLTRIS